MTRHADSAIAELETLLNPTRADLDAVDVRKGRCGDDETVIVDISLTYHGPDFSGIERQVVRDLRQLTGDAESREIQRQADLIGRLRERIRELVKEKDAALERKAVA